MKKDDYRKAKSKPTGGGKQKQPAEPNQRANVKRASKGKAR